VSCSWNAWLPVSTGVGVAFAAWTAVSRIVVPAASVRRNVSSSAYATWLILSKFVASSG